MSAGTRIIGAMSFWVPPSLRFACDSDGEFTAESVQRIVEQGTPEGDELDYKGGLDPGPDASDKFLAEVVSFANLRGGLLIFGVKEKDDLSTQIVGMPGEFDTFRQQRTALVGRRVAPSLLIEVHLLPRAGAEPPLWVVVVPPSPRQPHAIRPDNPRGKTLSWPVRDGADTRFLSEPELADRYSRRFESASDRRRRLAEIAQAGIAHLTGDRLEWVYLALTPESPAQHYLDGSRIKSTRTWMETTWPTSVFTSVAGLDYRTAPRRIQAGTLDREHLSLTSAYGQWIELYQDGSAFVGIGCDTTSLDRAGVIHAQDLAVVDSLIYAVQVAGQWAIQCCGAWGSADLIAGTHEMPAVSWRRSFNREIQHPKIDPSPVARDDISVDLANLTALSGRLSLSHQLATELLQWYGIEQDLLITDDGSISVENWGREAGPSVQRWVQENAGALGLEPQ